MHPCWQVKDAIPAFEELVVPLASAVMADSTEGKQFRDSISLVRNSLVNGVAAVTSSSSPTDLLAAEVQTNFQAGLDLVDQLPGLLRMIADGAVEFTPSPDDTRESCRRMYRARRTLLLEFENDSIDESEELESVIQEAKDIMRLKRPMVKFDIRLEKITGTHITPLTQVRFLILADIAPCIKPCSRDVPWLVGCAPFPRSLARLMPQDVILPTPFEPLDSVRDMARENFLKTVDGTRKLLIDWLSEVA